MTIGGQHEGPPPNEAWRQLVIRPKTRRCGHPPPGRRSRRLQQIKPQIAGLARPREDVGPGSWSQRSFGRNGFGVFTRAGGAVSRGVTRAAGRAAPAQCRPPGGPAVAASRARRCSPRCRCARRHCFPGRRGPGHCARGHCARERRARRRRARGRRGRGCCAPGRCVRRRCQKEKRQAAVRRVPARRPVRRGRAEHAGQRQD